MRAPYETGVILSGGGARAAYQIGVLRAIARILGRGSPLPFRVICGTSAGAVNAALLGANADSFSRGAARTVSMLDSAPLRSLLRRELDLDRVAVHIAAGRLHALAINATSYTTGHALTFFQGAPTIEPWQRIRRRGERAIISVDHLLASSAIPFIFPAARVGDDYYADGSVRQIAPLSPALHLGARRMLVIAVGQFIGQQPSPGQAHKPLRYPSFAQVAGHALSSIFLDNLGADLERLQRLNRVLGLVPHKIQESHPENVHVDALVVG